MVRKIRIAPVELAFAPSLQVLAEDPEIGATSNVPSPYPPDGAVTWIQAGLKKREEGTELTFAILLDGEPIGACGLVGIDRAAGVAELGYWVGKPYWGLGAASEAARQLADLALGELGFTRLTSHCLVRNPASARVLEKAGFRYLGTALLGPESKWPGEEVRRYERGKGAGL